MQKPAIQAGISRMLTNGKVLGRVDELKATSWALELHIINDLGIKMGIFIGHTCFLII